MYRLCIMLFIPFFIPALILANGISGFVKDEVTGEPLAEVAIDIENLAFRENSSESGYFKMVPVSPGTYRLRASCPGYQLGEAVVEVHSDLPTEITLYLRPSKLYTTEVIVVTARRHETRPFEVAEAVSALGPLEIKRKTPRTTPEALMNVHGVWMQKTNHGGGSPFIRGLTGNQVLMMTDGIRLNNATFRYGPNQYLNTISTNSVDRIEVIRGSGSVLYGSDALGGVINIFSKTPRFSSEGINITGHIGLRYMSQDMDRSLRGEVQVNAPKWAIHGGMDVHKFGDIVAGGELGTQAPSGYDELAGEFKSLILLSSNHLLTVAYQQVHQEDVPRFDQVALRGYAKYSFDPQIRQLGYLRTQSFLKNDWIREIQITLSYNRSVEERVKQKEDDLVIRNERDEVGTWGLTAEIHSLPQSNWRIISGIELYRDLVSSRAIETDSGNNLQYPLRGLYPDGSSAGSLALFSSHSFDMDSWLINFGARFNAFRISSEDEEFGELKITPHALVGNASALFRLQPQQHLTFSVSTGFRAPNINDLSSFGSFDFGIEVPGYNLAPEKSFTIESGYKVLLSGFSSSLAFYRTQLSDLIVRVPSTYQGSTTIGDERVYKRENSAEAVLYGFEGDFELEMPFHISAYGYLVYTYGQNQTNDEPMRRIPPLYGRLGFRYSNRTGLWSEIEWVVAAAQNRLAAGDVDDHRIPPGGTPGWHILNLRAGLAIKPFEINLGIQNIFNAAYRIHGSGVDGYGRSMWISLRFGLD